jgi:uncharacterized protein (TIGR02217 family)
VIGQQSDGVEQRRSMWIDPLVLCNLAEFPVDKSQIDYLLDFHEAVKGSAIGFRLRDWSDYLCRGYVLGTGNGNGQTWQLIKTYTMGGGSAKRLISKPVAETVVLKRNGVIQNSGWVLDSTTGIITTWLTGTLSVDAFEFDVPVRFDQDKINFRFDGAEGNQRIFQLSPLTCTEIRIQPGYYPDLVPLPYALPLFDLGFDYGTIGGPSFQTSIAMSGSEFEDRKIFWNTPLGSWNIGDRGLNYAELDYFIRFFRVARGQAIAFSFYDWQDGLTKRVRFAEDVFRVRFDAYRSSDKQVIFNLGGIGLKQLR